MGSVLYRAWRGGSGGRSGSADKDLWRDLGLCMYMCCWRVVACWMAMDEWVVLRVCRSCFVAVKASETVVTVGLWVGFDVVCGSGGGLSIDREASCVGVR